MKAQRVRRNPWVTAASCIPWAAALMLTLAWMVTGVPYAVLAPHLAILGVFAFTYAWRRRPRARLEPVHVATDASSLLVDDERIPRERVKRAELLPNINNSIVRVALDGKLDEDFVVDDEESAHALLKQLGFDPSQTTASYRAGSLAIVHSHLRFAPLLLVPVIMVGTMLGKPAFPALLPLLLIAVAGLFMVPAKVTVGVDGVLVQWLGTREFIAAKDILTVRRFERGSGKGRVLGVELVVSGREIRLPMSDEDRIAMVVQRIHDAVGLSKGAGQVTDQALLLARGDLDVRDWMTKLKALGSGATATLRTAAVMPEHLWRVAEDPAQPAIQRAAAAIALVPSLAETDKLRLADVAKTTAEPKLRIALERAAEGADDEELEQALRELT